MTTLSSIGTTIGLSSVVGISSVALFGCAVRKRSVLIAPRCTARPAAVIYNPQPTHVCQDRGNPWTGWICWTLRLPYDVMLRGIPGTGTRDGGLSGSLLRVQLDAVVLLRFHSMCLRVSAAIAAVCLILVLPMYVSSQCFGREAKDEPACSPDVWNTTDYLRTTVYNVPPLNKPSVREENHVDPTYEALMARLYAVVFLFLGVIAYVFFELKREWIQIIAMRRVYFLEYNVWSERREEHKRTLLLHQKEETTAIDNQKQHEHCRRHRRRRKRRVLEVPADEQQHDDGRKSSFTIRVNDDDEDRLIHRDPWIPHPEQRDTVPNVSLYSVLVGNLPTLPEHAAGVPYCPPVLDDDENAAGGGGGSAAAFAREQQQQQQQYQQDWLLSVTAEFFDHCVPNQPGYSSSVAAVTIVPGARDISLAWRKWYVAAGKLRRLRFFRGLIAAKLSAQIKKEEEGQDDEDDDDEDEDDSDQLYENYYYDSDGRDSNDEERPISQEEHRSDSSHRVGSEEESRQEGRNGDSNEQDHSGDDNRRNTATLFSKKERSRASIYLRKNKSKSRAYYREVIGPVLDEEADALIYETLRFGPEQTAVYSREFATAAAGCCPVGCRENQLRQTGELPELLTLEQQTAEELQEAIQELRTARQQVAHCSSPSSLAFAPATITTEQDTKQRSDGTNGDNGNDRKDRVPSTQETGFDRFHHHLPADLQLESDLYFQYAAANRSSTASSLLNRKGKKRHGSVLHVSNGADDDPQHNGNDDGNEWNLVNEIVADADQNEKSNSSGRRRRSPTKRGVGRGDGGGRNMALNGAWRLPSWSRRRRRPRTYPSTKSDILKDLSKWIRRRRWCSWKGSSTRAVVFDELARDSTFAVVTFTSRQAAVAARHCLADGRGAERWIPVPDLPVPPLADAAACNVLPARNCCRPFTISINTRQKRLRQYFTIVLLAVIYVFYTIPFTAIGELVSPKQIQNICPECNRLFEATGKNASGFLTGILMTLFLTTCPSMFRWIANFSAMANSIATAEYVAQQYYWWFMVLTAFTGSMLASMFLDVVNNVFSFGYEIWELLEKVSRIIPTEQAVIWLNWIIVRTLITLPMSYLLQINTFLFSALGLKCCSRTMRGGGPGAPVPYRIYIDSGVVLMCAFALAPQSPLVAPACFFYFLFAQPLLRRNAIFMYRPAFDGGGLRWPFIFNMCISAMVVGQVLLATQMALKKALGPMVIAFVAIGPILMMQDGMNKRFLPAYEDAALMQTSLLDGWNTVEDTSEAEREEFRRFLVDAHKAAYVPICIAGTDTDDFLTAEPAVVIPLESDDPSSSGTKGGDGAADRPPGRSRLSGSDRTCSAERREGQHGAIFRRAVHKILAQKREQEQAMSPAGSEGGGSCEGARRSMSSNALETEKLSLVSPFDRSAR